MPEMGLSLLSRLQQKSFFKFYKGKYFVKQVGTSVIMFKETSKKSFRHKVTERQLEALSCKKFTGLLSNNSRKKIIAIAQNWQDTLELMNENSKQIQSLKRKQLILLTLTLSEKQHMDDREVKRKMLGAFIQELVRKDQSVRYLWKAEAQQNGNIHFHLLLDCYYDKIWIQRTWNRIQFNNLHHSAFLYEGNPSGAPSTRIESLRDKYNSIAYIAKYMGKNEDERDIEGRLWGCSSKLRELKALEVKVDKVECMEMVQNMCFTSDDVICEDQFTILKGIPTGLLSKFSSSTNFTWDAAKNHNLRLLLYGDLNPIDSLKNTLWFKEVEQEYGVFMTSYLINNDLMFKEDIG